MKLVKNFCHQLQSGQVFVLENDRDIFFKTAWKQLLLLKPQYYVYVLESIPNEKQVKNSGIYFAFILLHMCGY